MTRLYKYFVGIMFYPDGFNLERTGVCLRNGRDSMVVKATYAVTLADEPALAKVRGSKSHSGKKPCIKCKHILGRVGTYADFVSDPTNYCIHHLVPDSRRFDLHDRFSFNVMAGDLQRRVEGGCTKGIKEAYERIYGIIYVKDGASFSEHVRRVTTTPEDVYYDPMHCWYSSGGIAQLHVNCLLQKFIANHISIADIERFIREVRLPIGSRNCNN